MLGHAGHLAAGEVGPIVQGEQWTRGVSSGAPEEPCHGADRASRGLSGANDDSCRLPELIRLGSFNA